MDKKQLVTRIDEVRWRIEGKKKNGELLYDLTEKMAIIHFTSFRY